MSKLIISFSFFVSLVAQALPTNEKLQIGIAQEFDNLNPIITNMLASTYLLKLVTRNFVIVDDTGKKIPQIVESVPTIENGEAKIVTINGAKKIQAIWKIRKNARWGDGVPVDCEDLAFSVKVAVSGKIPVPNLRDYENVESVVAADPEKKHCLFTYKEAHWDFNKAGSFYFLPRHLEEPVFEKYGQNPQGYENNSNYSKNPTNPGLFSGPYRITELKLGSHVVFEPNKYFYGEPPKIKKIIVRLISNTATLEANLLSNTIDMISLLGMDMDQALKFEKRIGSEKLSYNVNYKPSIVYEHIRLNLGNELLKDKRVRQALVYSINRKELTDVLFVGKQPPALHFVTPQDPWYTEDPKDITIYPYSLRKARKLLDEAGWKVGKDGFRYRNEKKLEISFMTTAGKKSRELVQQYLKDQWGKAGVAVIIKNYPPRVFFGEYLRKAKFDHMAMSATVNDTEQDMKPEIHSSSIPTEENGYSGVNRMRWKNKQVDLLIDQLAVEFNAEKRIQLVHKILGYYTEEVPVIPLYYKSDISITPKNLKGYFLTGNYYAPTNYAEHWTLD